MAITSQQIQVGTTPTLIHLGDSATNTYLHCMGIMYLGDSTVTTSTGYKMDNGDKLTVETHETSLYAIVSTGTTQLDVLVISK
jgi:hypothetical protein